MSDPTQITIGDAEIPSEVNETYIFSIERKGTEFELVSFPHKFADIFGMKMVGIMLGNVADYYLERMSRE